MLFLLSPAKKLDYDTPVHIEQHTQPLFVDQAAALIKVLKALSADEVAGLMSLSPALAELNVARYAAWSRKFTQHNARQAVLAFNGDVYEGLQAATLSQARLEWAQEHVAILSGLYGVLRPLDRMHPYRLEMGTRLANPRGKDLYAFWGEDVTQALNRQLAENGDKALVNLASEEYFKVVKPKLLDVPVITPVFEDWKNGKYKIISFFAKRARGMMARYAAQKGISDPHKLKKFDVDGYAFEPSVSGEREWVFRRKTEA